MFVAFWDRCGGTAPVPKGLLERPHVFPLAA